MARHRSDGRAGQSNPATHKPPGYAADGGDATMPEPRTRSARPADATDIQTVARASWHEAYVGVLSPARIDELVDRW